MKEQIEQIKVNALKELENVKDAKELNELNEIKEIKEKYLKHYSIKRMMSVLLYWKIILPLILKMIFLDMRISIYLTYII